MTSPLPPPSSPLAARIQGVYAITADETETRVLLRKVEAALQAGIRVLQYRNKLASAALKVAQLSALKALCDQHRCLLIVNDDWRLALDLGIEAVHLGRDDGDLAEARAAMGDSTLIGVSCYASLDRARQLAPKADYLAFGALFASGTKPQASGAALSVLTQARALNLGRPIVGIGGIDAGNLPQVLSAGANAGAVIGALFNQPDVGAAARQLLAAAALHE
ncbi:MAG: thiamine phosphate synthase [Lautropia sp.]|nr:thiamine phosphate synthase [Lautropia sp.]